MMAITVCWDANARYGGHPLGWCYPECALPRTRILCVPPWTSVDVDRIALEVMRPASSLALALLPASQRPR